jgi:hypothetical protein
LKQHPVYLVDLGILVDLECLGYLDDLDIPELLRQTLEILGGPEILGGLGILEQLLPFPGILGGPEILVVLECLGILGILGPWQDCLEDLGDLNCLVVLEDLGIPGLWQHFLENPVHLGILEHWLQFLEDLEIPELLKQNPEILVYQISLVVPGILEL